jgi:hypothetical protein
MSIQGSVAPMAATLTDPERKAKKQELLQELQQVAPIKADVKRRVLCHIINDAVRSAFSQTTKGN